MGGVLIVVVVSLLVVLVITAAVMWLRRKSVRASSGVADSEAWASYGRRIERGAPSA